MTNKSYTVSDLHLQTHPVALKIAEALKKYGPLFVDAIKLYMDKFGINKFSTTFYLMRMENAGLIKSEIRETGYDNPIAARFVEPTEKMNEIFTMLKK